MIQVNLGHHMLHLRLLILLICSCLFSRATTADLIDPWSDLRPEHAVRCLVALRPALDRTPDDQHLLGQAIAAYVTLCLYAHPERDGTFGPWLDYARTLVERRRKARGGTEPATIEAAASELWVRLITGDATGVLTELDRLPRDPASQHAVVLRALASSDWRPLAASPLRGALIDYAGMTLFHRTLARRFGYHVEDDGDVVEAGDHRLMDPYVACSSYWLVNPRPNHVKSLPGEAVAGIALLLRGSQIDDATAMSAARQLLNALGVEADPMAGCAQLLSDLRTSARSMKPDNVLAMAAAERIALAHADGVRGILDANGKHLLIGVGDVAQWVRGRLLDATCFAYAHVWTRARGSPNAKFDECDRTIVATLRREIPDALLTAESGTGYENPIPKSSVEALGKAIVQERARTHPLPDLHLVGAIDKLAYHRPDLARPIITDVFARWPTSDGVPARSGVLALLSAAWRCGLEVDLATFTRTLSRRNPADAKLRGYADTFDPEQRLLAWNDLPPTTTWTGTNIDVQKGRFPQLRHPGGHVAVSWDGWLRIDAPGTYQFEVVSGCFKARIGGLILTTPASNMLFPKLPGRTSAAIRIDRAGWIPLWLDYWHDANYWHDAREQECRLLWKPPSAQSLTLVPLALLAHGPDHAPGLTARAVEARQARTTYVQVTGIPPDIFTWAAAFPWHADIHRSLGASVITHRQFAQMLPVARAEHAVNPRANTSLFITCQLMQGGADLDEALETLRSVSYWPGDFLQQRLLVSRLREAQRLEPFALVMQKSLQQRDQSYLRALLCLPLGRFAEMQPILQDGLGDASLWIVDSELRPLCLLAITLNRMYGKPPPDFKRLTEQAGIPKNHPGYELAEDILAGLDHPAAVAALSPWNQDLTRWAHALRELSEGNHEQARAHLTTLTTSPTSDPAIAELCRDLLHWYGTQTAQSLLELPKSQPVKRRQVTTANPGAEDF